MLRYFAYGSNMLVRRIRQPDRAPSAVPLSTGTLVGHRLHFHKRSVRDGSGKCNVIHTNIAGDLVHGVVFEISRGNGHTLDVVEGRNRGYTREEVDVMTPDGWVRAFTYVAEPHYIDDGLQPYHWYKGFVVAGADEHRLPSAYQGVLRVVPSMPDPDATRDLAARRIMAADPL